ncbi:MAG: hypothetical protein ACFHHU_09035 [Porticoccaceae bacterium]
MKKVHVIGLSLIAILVGAALIAVNLPLRLFVGDMLDDVEYTDLEGASLLSGDVWVNAEGIQGPMRVQYHWCPGFYPGRWCASVDHASAKLETYLILRGLDTISFKQMHIQAIDMQSLGLAGGLVSARVAGEIEQLDWVRSDCPLTGIKYLQGNLVTSNLGILGTSTGAHRVDISTVSEGVNISLGGDTFSGTIEIRDNDYAAQGELVAPESMLSMARSLMRPLGNNRFAWEISGKLPC